MLLPHLWNASQDFGTGDALHARVGILDKIVRILNCQCQRKCLFPCITCDALLMFTITKNSLQRKSLDLFWKNIQTVNEGANYRLISN